MIYHYTLDELETLEEQVRQSEESLGEQQRKQYYASCKNRLKDPDTYATLNYFLTFGLHHFYLGRIDRFTEDMVGCGVGFFLVLNAWFQVIRWNYIGGLISFVIGIGILAYFTLTEIIELFKSENIVRTYNLRQKMNLLKQLEKI